MEGGGSDWRPVKGEAAGMGMDAAATGDWRTQLKLEARGRIVKKIMDTLQRQLPIYGHEALGDLRNIARRFEERIFTAATNQSDYLWKISLKMFKMETKTQNPGSANQMPSNSTSQNLPDRGKIMSSSSSNILRLRCPCGCGWCDVIISHSIRNLGRYSYKCKNPRNKHCKFFLWCDLKSSATGVKCTCDREEAIQKLPAKKKMLKRKLSTT